MAQYGTARADGHVQYRNDGSMRATVMDAALDRLQAVGRTFDVLEKPLTVDEQRSGDVHATVERGRAGDDLPEDFIGKPSRHVAGVGKCVEHGRGFL